MILKLFWVFDFFVPISKLQRLPQIRIVKIKDAALISVDHMGFPVLVIAFVLPSIGHMDVSVDKKTWMVFVHQSVKYLKSLMGEIPPVI